MNENETQDGMSLYENVRNHDEHIMALKDRIDKMWSYIDELTGRVAALEGEVMSSSPAYKVSNDSPLRRTSMLPCNCYAAMIPEHEREGLLENVLHRLDGPCYALTPLAYNTASDR